LTGVEARDDLVVEHRAICDGIRDGNTEQAIAALGKHFDDAVISLTMPERRGGVAVADEG
jgi:DNA-binding GntR family transcriptional regulator